MSFLSPQLGLLINTLTPTLAFWLVAASILLVLLYKKEKRKAAIFTTALFATTLCVEIIKLSFAVPRPQDALIVLSTYAFPSGHAASSAFLATSLLWLYKSTAKNASLVSTLLVGSILLGFALLIAYSRILIGVHTPLQVVTGFCIGVAIPLAVIFLSNKQKPSISSPSDLENNVSL